MRLQIRAVGRLKAGAERDLIKLYRKRLTWSLEIREIDDRKVAEGGVEKIAHEARLLMAGLPTGHALVALDESGQNLSSRAFAERLSLWQDATRQPVVFMIGGADGLDPAILKAADLTLSFGRMTWPHMMVRAMLCEQLFRAQSIHQGHPYHRG